MQKSQPKRSKSSQRVLMERLERARLKPRAWAVALVLEGYARLERDTGKRITSLYHEKIASIIGMSVETVRTALRELTTGPHPIYRKRNGTGRQHTIYGNNGFELTTTGAIYEWIDQTGDDESRATPTARMHVARPYGGRGYKRSVRCLTAAQVAQFAADVQVNPDYGELLPDGQKRIAEYHALRRHVDDDRCERCRVAVARAIAVEVPDKFVGVRFHDRCRCGALVARQHGKVFDLWEFAIADHDDEHRCDTAEVAGALEPGDLA